MVEKNSMEPHGHLDHFNYTASLRVGDQIQLNCNDTGLSITECMKKAIPMKDSHYQELSQLAKVDLEQYVRPLDEYAKEYLRLIQN